MDLGFNHVHVLITGASGGIGFSIAQLFLDQGARVTAHYNTKLGPLESAQKSNNKLRTVQANLVDEAAVKQVFAVAGDSWGQEVQVLILNHGIFTSEEVDLVDMELSQWDRCMNVNLTSSFLVAREFLRNLRSPRAGYEPDMSKVAVVVIGADSGEFGEESHIDYACVKSAQQIGFVRTLKYEIVKIAPAGRVNAVSPGWVNTPMAKYMFEDKELLERVLAAIPLRRVATPEDVANQVLVLASSKASAHVTGANIILAGGLEGRIPPCPAN